MGPENPDIDRRSVLGLAGVTATTVASGCLGVGRRDREPPPTAQSSGPAGTVEIAGSSTVYPLTLRIGTQFASSHPDRSVVVTSTGTGGGFSTFFCAGKTDLNGASRPITRHERDQCARQGVEFLRFQVATDAITVIVNNDADWIDCLTRAELATIWRRDGADRWSAVRAGLPDAPIRRYGPSADSGTFDYFAGKILGDAANHRQEYQGTEQDSTIVANVQQSRFGIGYLGFAYYRQNRQSVTALAIDDGDGCVSPSLETARRDAYALLARPLYLYVARDALSDPVVVSFLQYYLDRVDTALVSDVGYVPVSDSVADRNRRKLATALAGRR